MPTEYDTYETCVYCGTSRSVDWMSRVSGSAQGDHARWLGNKTIAYSTWACQRPTNRLLTETEAEFTARLARFDAVHPRRK